MQKILHDNDLGLGHTAAAAEMSIISTTLLMAARCMEVRRLPIADGRADSFRAADGDRRSGLRHSRALGYVDLRQEAGGEAPAAGRRDLAK